MFLDIVLYYLQYKLSFVIVFCSTIKGESSRISCL